MPTTHAILDAGCTERQLQDWLIDVARWLGWRAVHFRPARVVIKGRESWRTAVQGDGKGFPDTILARGTRLLVVECKRLQAPRPNAEQTSWLDAFRSVGAEVYELRPLARTGVVGQAEMLEVLG